VTEATEKEWEMFREEREAGVAEIKSIRERVAEEDARKRAERSADREPDSAPPGEESTMGAEPTTTTPTVESRPEDSALNADSVTGTVMDVDETPVSAKEKPGSERKEESTPMQPDDEDAVEY
jgi:hypothetical protein